MAQNNSIDNKSSELIIDPGASGDSFLQFDINGTGEFRVGVDDDASDSFKISQGSALGTNDDLIIQPDGVRTWPLIPLAKFTNSTARSNVTGDGTTYTMVWDNSQFDRTSSLSGSTTFTAPATGIYLVSIAITYTGETSSHTSGLIQSDEGTIARNLRAFWNPYALKAGTTNTTMLGTYITNFSTSETIIATFRVSNGAKVISTAGDASNNYMCISLLA